MTPTNLRSIILLFGLLLHAAAATPNVRVLLFPTVEVKDEKAALEKLAEDWSVANGVNISLTWATTKVTTDYAGIVTSYLKSTKPKPDAYDIYMMDVVWPGDFEPYLQPLDDLVSKSTFDSFNQDILANDRVNGKYVALPWYADYGLFFYRKDLLDKYGLQPPKTWDDLEDTASIILTGERGEHPALAGLVGQLDAYEGLTCNVAEWVKSTTGANILDENGLATFDNEDAGWILQKMRNWLDNEPYLVPTGSLVYREQNALDDFIAGDAIFMRNWPFCIKSIKDAWVNNTRWEFDFSGPPGRHANQTASTLGGWHLAISKQTKDAAAAAKVLEWLTSAEIQKVRATAHGVLPSIPSLYQDTDVCNTIKYCDLYSKLTVAGRPSAQSAGSYLAVSQRIYTAVHDFLAGTTSDVKEVLSKMRVETEKLAGTYVDPARGPPVFIEWKSPLAIAMIILYALTMGAFVLTGILIIINRHLRIIKASSPYFCLLMIGGALANLSTIFVYTGQATDITCVLQPWLLSLSFAFMLVALLEKNYRIFRIFNNPYMRTLHFSWLQFSMRASIILIIEMIILSVWTGYDRPKPFRVYLNDYNYLTCRSESNGFHWTMIGLLFAVNFLLVAAAVGLAWITRHVKAEYNEAKKIGFVVWNTASFAFITIAIIFIDFLGAKTLYAIRSIILWECNVFLLICFFGPIIKDLFTHHSGALSPITSGDSGKRKGKTNLETQMGTGSSLQRVKTAPIGESSCTPLANEGTSSDSAHMPVKTTINVHAGVLVGRMGLSKLALAFAPLHHYQIVLDPNEGFMSILAKDARKPGLSFIVETQDISTPTVDNDGIHYFTVCFNNTHYFQFLTSSKDVVDAWTERFKQTKKTTITTEMSSKILPSQR